MTVTIGNTTYLPGQSIPLPVGTTPLVYTIVDSTGKTATSPTTVTIAGPPSITAPADQTLNATSPAGVSSYTIPQPANTTCPQPTCQVSVLYNGTLYKPGDVIPLTVGTSTLTYTIVDSKGNTATDQANVDVVGPPSINAPAPATISTTNPAGATVTLQPPASEFCPNPNCTTQILINGTFYKPGDSVTLPLGNTTLTYVVTDALGQNATDPTVAIVIQLPQYVPSTFLVKFTPFVSRYIP